MFSAAWRALSQVFYPYTVSQATKSPGCSLKGLEWSSISLYPKPWDKPCCRLKSLEPSFVSIYPEPKDKPWLQLRALSQVVQYSMFLYSKPRDKPHCSLKGLGLGILYSYPQLEGLRANYSVSTVLSHWLFPAMWYTEDTVNNATANKLENLKGSSFDSYQSSFENAWIKIDFGKTCDALLCIASFSLSK